MSWVRAGASNHWHDKINAASRSWYGRLLAALILTGALICVMDVLAVAVRGVVNDSARTWPWGPCEGSACNKPTGTPNGVQLASVHLMITVKGDDLTAEYTVTSSSGQALETQAEQAQRAGNSDALVSDLFGGISVAQFKDGFTANRYGWTALGFMPPQLQVAGDKTTVTIASDPLRLLLSQQYVRVNKPPAGATDGPSGDLEFTYPSGLQVLDVNGASLTSTAGGDIDVRRNGAAVTATLREAGANWTTGLRNTGGTGLPVVGSPLQRLAGLVGYIALLWALARIRRNRDPLRDDVQSVVLAGMNAVRALVGAIVALAALGFGYNVMFELLAKGTGPLLAGPAGLALAGAVVLWPVACWRVAPAAGRPAGGRNTGGRNTAGRNTGGGWGRDVAVLGLIGAVFLGLIVAWSGTRPVEWWRAGAAVAGIVVLEYLLGRLLLRPSALRSAARLAVLATMLVAVLASTVVWPVLVYTGFYQGGVLDVNLIGKWVYFAAAVITIVGLCVMVARVVGVLSTSHRRCLAAAADGPPADRTVADRMCRRWRWTWRAGGGAVIALTLAATIPYLVRLSEIGSAHAEGLVPAGLASYSAYSGLYRALPQLLSWLLLALAICILLAISRAARATDNLRPAPDPARAWELVAERIVTSRMAARQLALPVMMLILFSAYTYYYSPWAVTNYTWAYVPVTPLLGLAILAWVLPARQATADRTRSPREAIRLTLRSWRNAEFADSQRQQLLGNADDLRKSLFENGAQANQEADGRRTFETLANVQNVLSEQRDDSRRSARAYLREAFDHQGEPPDPVTARQGALVGALLGLVPAVVLFLVTRPVSDWSGYPVLDFVGFTAWVLLIWPALGWAMGYFLPFIRGRNGINKALFVYITVGASLPMNLLWLDSHEWKSTAIYYLELFAFLVIVGIIIGDLLALSSAGMSPLAWVQVHNWRFLVTWSTAVLAAIGTVTVTFLSTAATDLGQQATTAVIGQSAPGSTSVQGSGHGG